jgi:Txe/YoeB family toxin of Txe-Axe toxin-antitoxin module
MISRTLARFWRKYETLPPEIRRQAREAYRHFQQDPFHPGLRFHPLRAYPDLWSVRITLSYRAVCRRDGDTLYWFWIGSHADFDRDFG